MNYNLDRTTFKHQTLEEADNKKEYWQSKTINERLRAAWYLTCTAWGIPYDRPLRLDRMIFSKRTRI